MKGLISGVENHGSIVIVWLDSDNGGSEPVYMDHRAFGWLVEGESIESPDDLIGRPVYFNGESIEVLDILEAV